MASIKTKYVTSYFLGNFGSKEVVLSAGKDIPSLNNWTKINVSLYNRAYDCYIVYPSPPPRPFRLTFCHLQDTLIPNVDVPKVEGKYV